ncbi:hypothetical protein F7725_017468 [Dissostichus mawsoni]|uniref:AB hydrolase-1 domain-containing protein n=1 Tax=Dissostichus mawsoni TaxID=36200 RepID=A0A7J5Z4H8_DISMA|nr:hypothetical protein F7725_017468 [Dissostichus mawsoni]
MEMIMISGCILVLPVFAFIYSFMFWPGYLLKAYNWYMRLRLGLVIRYCKSGSYRFCYSSRGTPGGATPSLLLLHGFSASKDMWLPIVKHLPRGQHVVCVDMPGHEGTTRTGAQDYCIQGQVARIHQFVKSIGLDKRPFHLAGTSMGGNVAGVYAAHHPAHLSGVTLMCPAGLVFPTESEFIIRLREMEKTQQQGSIPLIPTTTQELESMLKLCCYTPISLPKQLLRGLLDNRVPNNDFYKEDRRGEVSSLAAGKLAPDHIPGAGDLGEGGSGGGRVGAAVLQAALPNCQVELIENCGHSVALERPRKSANLIMDFLSKKEVNGGNAKKLS